MLEPVGEARLPGEARQTVLTKKKMQRPEQRRWSERGVEQALLLALAIPEYALKLMLCWEVGMNLKGEQLEVVGGDVR